MTETLQEAVDRLAALATVDEIEKYLVSGGYVEGAEKRCAFYCPVANYLNDKLDLQRPTSVTVDSLVFVNGATATYFPKTQRYHDVVIVELPKNVEDFIVRYDA